MPSRSPLPSSFELLVNELLANDDRPAEAPGRHRLSIDSLEAAWLLAANARAGKGEAIAAPRAPYSFDGEEHTGPEHLLDPNKILIELGLGADISEEDIATLRREFAFRNHPDRVVPELREIATQRMMIANDLMDRYLSRLRRASG